MAERLHIDVNVRAVDDPPLPEEMKILVFETVRELLFNCAKHSGVQRAEVGIALTDGTLYVTVSDEGVGFDPLKHAKPGKMGTGFGLFGVRERLQLVGGSLEIASAPGAGCRFHLRVPLGMGDGSGDVHPSPGPSAQRIRVLLVDDHAVVRQGLSMMLSKEPDIEVIGEAQDGWQALELAKRLAPDVVLMDISMPGLNGIEATRIICAELPDTRVLGLSMLYEEGESSEAIRAAGAVGYVSKGAPACDLLATLRDCMNRPASKPWPAASPEGALA
jgi:CheY-like chemotaxis protein